MTRTVQCVLMKKEGEGLDYAPYPGDLGQRILNRPGYSGDSFV